MEQHEQHDEPIATPPYPETPAMTAPVPVDAIPSGRWQAGQHPVGTDVAHVASAHPDRRSIVILNNGAVTAYLGDRASSAHPSIGFPLAPGASLSLDSCGEVYAVTSAGSTTLGLVQTFRGAP